MRSTTLQRYRYNLNYHYNLNCFILHENVDYFYQGDSSLESWRSTVSATIHSAITSSSLRLQPTAAHCSDLKDSKRKQQRGGLGLEMVLPEPLPSSMLDTILEELLQQTVWVVGKEGYKDFSLSKAPGLFPMYMTWPLGLHTLKTLYQWGVNMVTAIADFWHEKNKCTSSHVAIEVLMIIIRYFYSIIFLFIDMKNAAPSARNWISIGSTYILTDHYFELYRN